MLVVSAGTPTWTVGSAGPLVPVRPADSPSLTRPGPVSPGNPSPAGRADLPAPTVEADGSRAAGVQAEAPPAQEDDLADAPPLELSGLGQGLRDLVRRAVDLMARRPGLSALVLTPVAIAFSAALLYGLDCRRRRAARLGRNLALPRSVALPRSLP
jgi:hypothetical protein